MAAIQGTIMRNDFNVVIFTFDSSAIDSVVRPIGFRSPGFHSRGRLASSSDAVPTGGFAHPTTLPDITYQRATAIR